MCYEGSGQKGHEFGITGENVLLLGEDGMKGVDSGILFEAFLFDGGVVEELLGCIGGSVEL